MSAQFTADMPLGALWEDGLLKVLDKGRGSEYHQKRTIALGTRSSSAASSSWVIGTFISPVVIFTNLLEEMYS